MDHPRLELVLQNHAVSLLLQFVYGTRLRLLVFLKARLRKQVVVWEE